MPEVRNCRKCGKIFNYIGGAQICPVCREQDETDFKRIKEYLYDNPGASMSDISAELDISVEKIKRFLKEGRLEIIGDGGNFVLECECCGKSIKSGRLCNECAKGLNDEIKSTVAKMNHTLPKEPSSEVQKKGVGMRYLNKEESHHHKS